MLCIELPRISNVMQHCRESSRRCGLIRLIFPSAPGMTATWTEEYLEHKVHILQYKREGGDLYRIGVVCCSDREPSYLVTLGSQTAFANVEELLKAFVSSFRAQCAEKAAQMGFLCDHPDLLEFSGEQLFPATGGD